MSPFRIPYQLVGVRFPCSALLHGVKLVESIENR